MSARLRAFARLGEGVFDVCVIGAGVLGTRIAYEARRDGLRVALVEAADFGARSSGTSPKLLGAEVDAFLRGELAAAGAAHEAAALANDVVPGLARGVLLVVALARGPLTGRAALAAALLAHDALSGGHRTRAIDATDARRLLPMIAAPSVLVRTDAVALDDTRLVLANALAAADAGAVVMNHARAVALAFSSNEARVSVRGPEGLVEVRARAVVNATGAWIDALRRMEDRAAEPMARLRKSVLVAVGIDGAPLTALRAHVDERTEIVIAPWQDGVLVGAGAMPYDDPPDGLVASQAEIGGTLDLAARFLPGIRSRDQVRAASAGLRVVGRDTNAAGRVAGVGRFGMVSVAGGSLTTHRRDAMAALQLLPPGVRPRRRAPASEALVARGPDSSRAPVSPGTLAHLGAIYGDRTEEVLAISRDDPSAFDRVHPSGPDVWAQVRYAISNEYAMTVDDITDRRTSLRWRGLADEPVRERIARMLLPRLVPS